MQWLTDHRLAVVVAIAVCAGITLAGLGTALGDVVVLAAAFGGMVGVPAVGFTVALWGYRADVLRDSLVPRATARKREEPAS